LFFSWLLLFTKYILTLLARPHFTCKIEFGFLNLTKMSLLAFLVICVHLIAFTTIASQSHGSEFKVKRSSNNSEGSGGFSLHSYMKQLYRTLAQGNGNGSFTISLGSQKLVATSIRGFEPERSSKYSYKLYKILRNLLSNLQTFLFNVGVTAAH